MNLTLEERVRRIEQLLGIGMPDYNPKTEEDALRSFLAGDSKPLELFTLRKRLKTSTGEDASQIIRQIEKITKKMRGKGK